VPDLARGLGLLGITVVNAPLLAPREAVDTVDRVSSVIVTGLLENRSWPMFALMFGFGIAAIGRSNGSSGILSGGAQQNAETPQLVALRFRTDSGAAGVLG
jgi:uncharacterized membrane protein YeiB